MSGTASRSSYSSSNTNNHRQQQSSHIPTTTSLLTSESQSLQNEQEAMILEMEVKRRAASIIVPALSHQVRDALRKQYGQPIRLFGENLADVRTRLRMIMAKMEVYVDRGLISSSSFLSRHGDFLATRVVSGVGIDNEQQTTLSTSSTTYTHASDELLLARRNIASYSISKAKCRLSLEQQRRRRMRTRKMNPTSPLPDEKKTTGSILDDKALTDKTNEQRNFDMLSKQQDIYTRSMYNCMRRSMGLDGSQYGGDNRPLSSLCVHQNSGMVVTGGWASSIKIWNGRANMELMGQKSIVHEDRIMGIAVRSKNEGNDLFAAVGRDERNDNSSASLLVATASIDLTAKLFSVVIDRQRRSGDANSNGAAAATIKQLHHLKGHQARLCRVAFHPMGRHVVTTSFDTTWRLWDVETGQELLLQDGHAKETFGVGMQCDGSLCATTDFGGVVQVWDLRTGKSICHFIGHARRVLCSEFSPNGFQLATAGDDGTIKVWDLRRRKQHASIPAHSNLVPQLRFSAADSRSGDGEVLASCSFDGTVRLWSGRDWTMLTTLRGHEGKVTGVDMIDGGSTVFTCGFDKTLKMWR